MQTCRKWNWLSSYLTNIGQAALNWLQPSVRQLQLKALNMGKGSLNSKEAAGGKTEFVSPVHIMGLQMPNVTRKHKICQYFPRTTQDFLIGFLRSILILL